MGLTIADLKARAQAVKDAPLFNKAPAAERLAESMLGYLQQLENRLTDLETAAALQKGK